MYCVSYRIVSYREITVSLQPWCGWSPHRDDGELDVLVDVLAGELDVTEVLFDVEGKLAVFFRLDDAFAVFEADDDALQMSLELKHTQDS